MFFSTCVEMRPQRCRSLPEDRAMVVAMAGGGLVFRLLQVQMSWDSAWRVSIRSFTNSHWNVRGLSGVLAAWRWNMIRISHKKKKTVLCFNMKITQKRNEQNQAWLADPNRKRRDSLLVGFECFRDGAHGCAVVSIWKPTEALLGLRELHQTVQPEVEVFWGNAGTKALVQLPGKIVAALWTNLKNEKCHFTMYSATSANTSINLSGSISRKLSRTIQLTKKKERLNNNRNTCILNGATIRSLITVTQKEIYLNCTVECIYHDSFHGNYFFLSGKGKINVM